MPFKSEAQRRYLWANEPEIARDWTDTYGSRIQKRMGGIMGSNAGSMLVAPTRDGSRPGYYGPDAGHENDPGHGSNTGAGDDHSYKTNRERQIHRNATTSSYTPAQIGTLSDPREKQDYFNQTWSGQPNFLGFGGGYRNLKTPNDARRGYQSRLNPMGVMSLLGGFMKKPFTLAATGINAVRNKFGPAWKDWTDSQYFNEFLNKRKATQYEDAIATDNLYDPNARIQDTSFEQDYNVPYYLDEFQPHGVDVENLYDEFPEEDTETIMMDSGDTEDSLEKAKRINERLKKAKRINDELTLKWNRLKWKRNPPWTAM